MDRFLLTIIYLYVITCPFYIFDSGLPQPSDGIAVLGIIYLLFSTKMIPFFKIKAVKRLFQFVALATFINLAYFFIYKSNGVDNRFYFPPLFYIFDMFFFVMILFILNNNFILKINHISLAILISLSVQVLMGLVHIGSGRSSLFFNNPNQLGYYSLVSLTVFASLPSKYRANKLIILCAVLFSSYLILLSGSRAALLGVALLSGMIFLKEGIKVGFSSSIFIIIVLVGSWYFLNKNDFFNSQIDSIKARQEVKANQGASEWQVRGYDRFVLNPEYVFFGAGEGVYERFNSYQHLEMHSGPGTILFSYGVLGFTFFFLFIKQVIKLNLLFNFLLLLPVFLYNLTHQGFREPLFWILLACIFVVSQNEYKQKINRWKLRQNRNLNNVTFEILK